MRSPLRHNVMPRIVVPDEESIAEAVQRLAAGDVIALPTETVYGLGADTLNPIALRKVYELKGRPSDNPLIAHVLDAAQARSLVADWSHRAELLAERLWPGPLTIILPKADIVPEEATAGLPTIAIRSPSHPVARAVLDAFGRPISAPSANRSGHVSPTRAKHVAEDFPDGTDLVILDGGSSACGIESTVLDLTTTPPRLLRPGAVDAAQIAAVLGADVLTPAVGQQSASPGTSPQHYAPRTPLEVLERTAIPARLRATSRPAVVITLGDSDIKPPHHVIDMPSDAQGYASALYDALRRADAMRPSVILLERPPRTTSLWQAVHNRLARAAHG